MADDEVATRWMVILPGSAPPEVFTRALPAAPSLKQLYEIIYPHLDGGLEHVSVWAAFHPGSDLQHLDMFVDDTGFLKGLPRNDRATAIYRQATMSGRTGLPVPDDPESLDIIAGPAVLFDRRVWR